MRYLIDTHVLLWWLYDDERLSAAARSVIADAGNRILVSGASAWEIATKHRLGKIPAAGTMAGDIAGWIEKARFDELPITIAHAERAGSWPQPHRDPFDRMLAAQSTLEDLPLITADPAFAGFGIRRLW